MRPSESTSLEDISGVKLLRKIKQINKGIPVIILTASNKAWNMKKLMEEGADGYFIKESPEILVSDDLSKANYESLVAATKDAFNRKYLRDIFKDVKLFSDSLSTRNYSNDFLDAIKKQLEIAFDMHYNSKSKEQFAFAYVSLYMIIELINKHFIQKNNHNEWVIDTSILKEWEWNTSEKKYYDSGSIDKITEWGKLANLYFQKWHGTDHKLISDLWGLIRKRNGFIHNDKTILDDKNERGDYKNHDIYNADGFKKLFMSIKDILGFL